MKNADLIAESGAVILTASQTQTIFQIISLVLTIIATLFSIISRLVIWYKKAKADGKITKEEMKEGANIIKDEIKKGRD